MIFKLEMNIPWNMERLHSTLLQPSMMKKVAYPIVHFKPLIPKYFPDTWEQGKTYKMSMYLFGVFPMGWQELTINSIKNTNEASLLDVGPGLIVRKWDHRVMLTKKSDHETRYEETLHLEAGIFTPIVWLGMILLFWWRKKRWIQITKT